MLNKITIASILLISFILNTAFLASSYAGGCHGSTSLVETIDDELKSVTEMLDSINVILNDQNSSEKILSISPENFNTLKESSTNLTKTKDLLEALQRTLENPRSKQKDFVRQMLKESQDHRQKYEADVEKIVKATMKVSG